MSNENAEGLHIISRCCHVCGCPVVNAFEVQRSPGNNQVIQQLMPIFALAIDDAVEGV